MTDERHDAIVVGAGGAGAACLALLAERGLAAVGVEARASGHADAASFSTRGFRKAYPVLDETYVPLAERAGELWRETEARAQTHFFSQGGALEVGPPDHAAVSGVAGSCRKHGMGFELLDADAVAARFPALAPAPDEIAVVEEEAGILLAAEATRALIDRARAAGAELREHAAVERIEATPNETVVWVDGRALRAELVVLAPGAGLPALLRSLGGPEDPLAAAITVTHPEELWFAPEAIGPFSEGAMAPFSWAIEGGSCFGVPAMAGESLKVCYRGGPLPAGSGAAAEEDAVRAFMRRSLPRAASAPLAGRRTCVVTATPDRHPLVGFHPEAPRVLLAGGLSGHGFKLAPALGEAIADLACDRQPRLSIAAFDPARLTRSK